MKIVTMYESEDGTRFLNEEDCIEYEMHCIDLDAANNMFSNGATLMAALNRANQTRLWWDDGLNVEDKVILMKTTKDTGFKVSHWQCSEFPGYKPVSINHSNKVLLYGDFSANGSYGLWVTLKDLLRYARQ